MTILATAELPSNYWRMSMNRPRLTILGLLSTATAGILAVPAAAQDQAPCTTQSECDARADAQAMRDRRATWDANVARENAFRADMHAQRAQARANTTSRNEASLQEIMRRRRAAAGN